MLEWYTTGSDLAALRMQTEELVRWVHAALSPRLHGLGRRSCELPRGRFECAAMSELFQECAGFTVRGDEPVAELRERCRQLGIPCPDSARWEDAFFALFVARIEPFLSARLQPLFLTDWPRPLAALAEAQGATAARFELYLDGFEVANAYQELRGAAAAF